jgi:hypothetical protein
VKRGKREGGQHVEHSKTRHYASLLFQNTPGETRRDKHTKRRKEEGGRRKEDVKKTQTQLGLVMADLLGLRRGAGGRSFEARVCRKRKAHRCKTREQNKKKSIVGRRERRERRRGMEKERGKGHKHTKNQSLSVSLLILSMALCVVLRGARQCWGSVWRAVWAGHSSTLRWWSRISLPCWRARWKGKPGMWEREWMGEEWR